jgi:diacylglycerol kinase (ATP)
MRAAAILGLGCSCRDLKPFQTDNSVEWRIGMPASGDDADVILLFGGDGTIHRHLGLLVRLGTPVLVVPEGSGNDFARAIGLKRVRDSLMAWRKFCAGGNNVRSIDLGVISPFDGAGLASVPHAPQYFCCVAGIGLDAEVARKANQLPRWLRGHGGYALSLLPTIFRFVPVRMKILRSDHEDEPPWSTFSEQLTTLAAFANTSVYGGGMKIAPRARCDDGLLDVCVIGPVDPFKLFCMFPTVYGGGHLKLSEIEYLQTRRVRVETEHPADVYADGEFVCKTPVEVGIQPAALRIVA